MVPATDEDPSHIAHDILVANRTLIVTHGKQTFRVAVLPSSRIPWAFLVAYVEQVNLGMNFLSVHNFLVALGCRCLLHQPSATVIHAEPYSPLLITFRQATQIEILF